MSDEQILESITIEQWRAILNSTPERWRAMEERAANRLVEVSNKAEATSMNIPLEIRVTDLLNKIGVPSHLRGYRYLREAIVLSYDHDYLGEITKTLYPKVAKLYGTEWHCVESSIRKAIEVAIERGEPEIQHQVFTTSRTKRKPSNTEAIANLVEFLKSNI